MRLLHVKKKKLEDFSTRDIPNYVILSHCWRSGHNEIIYEDVEYSQPESWKDKKKEAAEKVLNACAEADKLGYEYVWIDTCCIDKRSSSELSEAINSMFSWYRNSARCIAFLDDVDNLDQLDSSRWFTRGWTLQELIAPDNVWFYNKNWSYIGDRFSMAKRLSVLTRIDEVILRHGHEPELTNWDDHICEDRGYDFTCYCGIDYFDNDRLRGILDTYSVAGIMSWAADRQTSREEDIAYCLMGLFDVNMPLLYGEKEKAFIRLQEEIIRRTSDQSILAWASPSDKDKTMTWFMSLGRDLASSPSDFSHVKIKRKWLLENDIVEDTSKRHMSVTKEGLEVDLLLFRTAYPTEFSGEQEAYVAVLDCTVGDNALARPVIFIDKPPWSTNVFDRSSCNFIGCVTPSEISADGSVSKMVGKLLVSTTVEAVYKLDWTEEFDMSKGEVRRVTIARMLLRRGTHSRNRFDLPPLRIGKILGCDAGEYAVDYAMPDFDNADNVASACNESLGLALVMKQETPQFFVVWGPRLLILRDMTKYSGYHVIYQRDDIWCKVLPADDEEVRAAFAKVKEWGRHQRFENTDVRNHVMDSRITTREKFINASEVDRAVLDLGELRREVLLELKRGSFLGAAFFDLKIRVRLPPQEN
ncbi:heterokaryon incompatibility protein-domain-containing protein [Xylaria sp. FL1777]|nr:heterokaryon incompatibility protein-domain-containing protein [Xylaria sp. FL1777]